MFHHPEFPSIFWKISGFGMGKSPDPKINERS